MEHTFVGLTLAARNARRAGPGICKKLERVDASWSTVQHCNSAKCDVLLAVLRCDLGPFSAVASFDGD